MKALPFILYFVNGHKATPEQIFEGRSLPAKVQFRNATEVKLTDTPEKCDGVAGEVPPLYKDFPTAEQAIRDWEKELKEERARLEENSRKAEREFPAETKRPMRPKHAKSEGEEEAEEDDVEEASKDKAKASWGAKAKK